jgi:hypothetical protein
MSFLINRLRIVSRGSSVYDERFEAGVNIIEGENSSGKTTLMKLLYHALGGTIPERQWSKAARACDRVYVEIKIGSAILTVSRKAVESGLPPALIYEGPMENGLNAPIEAWREYPYSRTADRQSYSQLIFSLLGMPEAFGEEGEFVTFNQFLRAHYADQDSPNSTVLKHEDQFDKPAVREAIGNFILGGSDSNLADRERLLKEAERDLGFAMASVAAGNALLGSDYNELNADSIALRRRSVDEQIKAAESELSERQRAAIQPLVASDVESSQIADLSRDLSDARRALSDKISTKVETELEIRDSEMFIRTLEDRARYLTQAIQSAQTFGDLVVDTCPVCGTDVDPESSGAHCYLCKSDKPSEAPANRYISLLNSTQSQIEQSRRVQKMRLSRSHDLGREIEAIEERIHRLGIQLENLKITISSIAQEQVAEVQGTLGYLRSERERLIRDQRVVERLEAIRADRDRLNTTIAHLREEINIARTSANLRLASAFSAISRETSDFLSSDLDRQLEFHNNPHVEVNYRSNTFALDGQRAFSASSQAYLRNAIFLGTMFAANKLETMRHLQLLMLENLEDKGMEPDRYHRLHRTIVEKSRNLSGDWQILIATADLAEDVRSEVYRVGRFYTHGSKTLAVDVDEDE